VIVIVVNRLFSLKEKRKIKLVQADIIDDCREKL